MPTPQHGETEAEAGILRGLRLALELSIAILVVEAFGAFFSRSLSVTIDTIHNVPDILAFAVSWSALQATERGTSRKFTFGTHRLEVFAGLLNAALVLATGLAFGYEALGALVRGAAFAGPVDAIWILVVAVPVLGMRAANLVTLGRIPLRARDLNLRSVFVHLGSDLLITGALLAAGIVLVLRPSLWWMDATSALAIAALLVYESLPLFRDGWDVLTERTPRNLSLDAIERVALSVPRVAGVHDLHVWAVCPTLVCMTAHVRVDEMPTRDAMQIVADLRECMEREFGILHCVFEVESAPRTESGAASAIGRPRSI